MECFVFCFYKELECHYKKFLTALVLGFALINPLVQKNTVQKSAVTRSAIAINLKQTNKCKSSYAISAPLVLTPNQTVGVL